MKKCIFCEKEFKEEDYVIHGGWVKCPECKRPQLDINIQDSDHWSKTHNLRKLDFMEGMMEGFY
ncbi:hypothetical protein [Faecalibacillus faecis]|uniref:hypothetical protein n=1 Tax=Faecalibacillus faecis TaxID=1982628 RepID=UPI00386B05EF